MSVARARALQGLQSAFRSTTARAVPRVSAPARTALAVGRRHASSGGHGHAEPSSDVPWMIGAVAVTIPACWYLWPTTSADSGHHGGHDDHHMEESHAEEDSAVTEEPKEEDTESQSSGQEANAEATAESKTPKDQQEQGKLPGEPSASGKASGSQGEGQDSGSVTPTKDSQPKEGGGEAASLNKGNVKPDSDAGTSNESRKSEPDNKGGRKTRVDSGLQKDLGATQTQFEDGQEKAATSKPAVKGSEGDITSKQFGMSSTPTRHSHQIDESPEKSKKPEGPETAKVMGTVDPNRPQV